MQENKDNRQKWAEWAKKAQAKARALYEKIKMIDKKNIYQKLREFVLMAKKGDFSFMKEPQTPENKTIRFVIVGFAAVVGGPFMVLAFDFLCITYFISGGGSYLGRSSVNILAVSLPTLTVLWWFRTHDTRQQIQKTQENINANLFGMYLKMLFSENLKERVAGLLGLVSMKKKGLFSEEIDAATQQNLNLPEANLSNRNLSETNLSNANFQGGFLSGANFSNANLFGADLCAAYVSGADFTKAMLDEAKLSFAPRRAFSSRYRRSEILIPANLSYIILEGAKLHNANFEYAFMQGVRLAGAFAYEANFSGADLTDADLSGTSLSEADLRGANLTNTNIKDAIMLEYAKYSKETKFPCGFDPEEAGMKLVESPNRRKPSDGDAEGE